MKKANHGFILKRSQEIAEIKATAYLYEHEKSGAELMHLPCDDNNKVFCITFMTLPQDSTGCPHILEHSVLNGSKHFPAKGTFNELTKGSLNTFINAMTGSEATYYPIASTNAKDFRNLMHVYLDAVFFPNIYKEPEILMQEGWHYELKSADDELGIRGVVYNEMKGAFSSVDRLVTNKSMRSQFPDTPYGNESGGDPEVIPDLSYEAFLDFHRKYYHPSNSRIFLYGDLDLEEAMKLIDKEYLSKFERIDRPDPIPLQKPFAKRLELKVPYQADEGQDLDSGYYMSLNYSFSTVKDLELVNAVGVLGDLLLNNTAASLKRLIMASGLAGDAYCAVNDDMLQPTISLIFKRIHRDNVEKLEKLVSDELHRLAVEGFDKRLIEASISFREFYLREGQTNYPKGLFYHWYSASAWILGADPFAVLSYESSLKNLRKGLTEPYFEGYLKKMILENKHCSRIIFEPDTKMLARQEAELKQKLAEYKAGLDNKAIDKLVKQTAHLAEYQNAPDKLEDIKKIPSLDLTDIDSKAQETPREVEESKDYTLIRHPLVTNGIAYLKVYFDLSHAAEEDLPWLQLYASLVGEIDSENYGFVELSNEIDIQTGGLSLGLNMLNDYIDADLIHRKYMLSGKAIKDKYPRMLSLMQELALKPVFKDTDRIRSLVKMLRSRWESYMIRNGVTVAITRMLLPFSQMHHLSDVYNGLGFYHFIRDLDNNIESRMAELQKNMQAVKDAYFTRRNLKISLTADEEILPELSAQLDSFVQAIPMLEPEAVEEHFTSREHNEAICAPVKIQFVAKGGNFFRKGYSYTGKLRVLANILRNEFLHKEVRVKGGAYGCMSGFSPSGAQYFVSYMDPNLTETLDVFDRVPDYLRSFEADDREMAKFIIGDVSSLDYPHGPERKGASSTEDYLTGFTQEDKQQIRDEVLSTRVEDIRGFAEMIEALMSKNHYAVFGNEQKIMDNKDLFDQITHVF